MTAADRIRAVIVDDEPLAREGIRLRLAREPDVQVIGEFGNALHASAACPELEPDVLLLDVQMPGLDAFGVLSRLPEEPRPDVILVTAHQQHAVRAFAHQVDDYLLKPLDDDRFRAAIARLRARLQQRRDAIAGRRLQAAQQARTGGHWLTRVPLRLDGRVVLLPLRDVLWIEGAGDYVRLHTTGRSYLHRATMADLQAQLDPAHFARTHRSGIVNLAAVQQIEPGTHGECRLVLRDGTRVKVSRSQRAALEVALGIATP